MKTILVPTDFTENAMHAARYAATLARVYDAKILFLNIYTMPLVSEYEVVSIMNTDLVEMQQNAKINLSDFTDEFIKKTNFTPKRVSQLSEYGSVTDSIIEKSTEGIIDMIVMGTKGAHNWLERWLGTNTEKVSKLALCPVWIIPENAKLEYPQKILYAADFEENEGMASSTLLEIAHPLGATCKVVHVHEYFEPKVGELIEDTMQVLSKYFENENITFKEINRPDIIDGLEKYIEGFNPDVIAFARHEKSFLAKIFNTSISSHFLYKADIPLLTFQK
jgi:nucleotide-binding universal stress UspA family protein